MCFIASANFRQVPWSRPVPSHSWVDVISMLILPDYVLNHLYYSSQHAGDSLTSTSVLLLFSCCASQMSPSGLFISMREVLRKTNGREKALQRSREFLWAWRCETTISFVTFMAALSLTHHADSHTLRRHLAWDDSLLQLPRCPAAMFPLLLFLIRGAYYSTQKN